MALTLANLLAIYRKAIRNDDETADNCYSALNDVKEEFQAKAIDQLGANALNTAPSTFTITLTSAYSYSLATANPTIGRIIEVKYGNGTNYIPMRRTEGLWSPGMYYDLANPEYRISGNTLEIKFEPWAGNSVVIVYAPTISTVSASYTGTSTTQSYQIDEVDRAWAYYSGYRHFQDLWEDNEAQRCYNIYFTKLLQIQSGGV